MKRILLFALLALQVMTALAQNGDVNKMMAMQLVALNQKEIGLSDEDMANVTVSSSYVVTGTNQTMVYLQQNYKGVKVQNKLKVLAFKDGKLIANSGVLVPDMSRTTMNYSGVPSVGADAAVRRAFQLEKIATTPGAPVDRSADGQVVKFGKLAGVTEDVVAELFWFTTEKDGRTTCRLGWQVQVAPQNTDDIWQVQIDANTGEVIGKWNMVLYENLEKPNRPVKTINAETQQHFRYDLANNFGTPIHVNRTESPNVVANATYNVIPYPIEAPSYGSAANRSNPWTAAAGNASSLGWHSDGTNDYAYTRGNNVWAAEDTIGNDVALVASSAASSTPNPNLTFNFTPNYTVEPSLNNVMQRFCITNLFYWTNVMHDMMYQYGFDEVSGNFQTNNQGRGGNGNDAVTAFAQSGRQPNGTHVHIGNNANFATGADGGLGRMRMYLFNSITTLRVNTPGSIAGNYAVVESNFSLMNKLPAVGPVTGDIVYWDDGGGTHEGCGTATNSVAGKIALIDRGTCPFVQKALNAQSAGAIGVIIVNNVPNQNITMIGDDNNITIPAVACTQEIGAILKANLSGLNGTLSGTAVFDGDLDAGIMTHEYGHGISNRLTGGPATASCLNNAEQGGEGWSDYLALMMTTNWSTATTTSGTTPRPVGTYVIAEGPTGEGIRNYPYSTNITVNPLTYQHMGLGTVAPWIFGDGNEVHNTGEIWCAALWEMTWGIIQQENSINTNLYNFSLSANGGNSIALKLVMEGMRLQPCQPGFIDARNAILLADRNLYGGRHQCAIWTAFAKRGMGAGASQGAATSTADQTASFTLPPAPTINSQPTNVSINPGDNASFSITTGAAISGAVIYYQWQVSTDGGTTWTDITNGGVYSGATTASLTITGATASLNNNRYRCVATQGCAITNSNNALLTVAIPAGFTFGTPAPTVSACPAPNTMDVVLTTAAFGGFTNAITVSASTPPAGTTVSFLPSASVTPGNSVTVRLTGTASLAPGTYPITITGTASGATTQTRDVTFTISAGTGPAISAQPANVTICAGANTSFSITSATATTFKWQVSTDGGTTWTDVANGGIYSNATTATLNITGATATLNNNRYRAIASTVCGSTTSSAAILTVNSPGVITTQPSNASVCTGSNQTISVVATGSPLTYQWELSTDNGATWNPISNGGVYSNATTANLTITGVTAALNNNRYRVVITGTCAPLTVTSNAAILTVASSLSITGQPSNATICSGNNTSFTVTATGAGTYQWQVSTDGGVTWSDVSNGGVYSNATTATLNITGATTALNGNRYRSQLTSGCGNATSSAAILTVNTAPAITTQPVSQTLCTGANATFTVAATGTGINFQWETSANGCAGPWTAIPSATTATLTLNSITAGQNNTGYRCVITGTCAPVVTSNCALLTVATAVNVTTQPVDQTVCVGANASFTVAGSGTGVIYQWQVSTDGGATWTNVSNTGVYSGATTATLSITGATSTLNTNRYRALLTNASCTTPGTSNAAILTVNTLPAITTQPVASTICTGGNTSFTVAATGTGLTYQWQVSLTGCAGTFTNLVNGAPYSGVTSSTLTITNASAALNGAAYRVVVSGTCSPAVNSNCVVLNVGSTVSITAQPVAANICSGSDANFNVTGSGTGILYQWQVSTNGGTTWTNITGATNASLTVSGATTALNGNQYRVLLSNAACTTPAISTPVLLTVRQLPSVTLTAAPYTSLLPTQQTTLTATPSASTGGTLTYSWIKDGQPLANNATTYLVGITQLGTYRVNIQETFTAPALTCSNQSQTVTISATESPRLFIFPVPNDGRFTVMYFNPGGASTTRTLNVFDSKGAIVHTSKHTVVGPYTPMAVDIRPAQQGVYYVVVGDANGKKLVEGKVMVAW